MCFIFNPFKKFSPRKCSSTTNRERERKKEREKERMRKGNIEIEESPGMQRKE